MPSRLGDIKFNLMRAIELFQDMNYEDMDVTAPPSDAFVKEQEFAQKLDDYFSQLISDGFFDNCDRRGIESSEEDVSYDSDEPTTPRSEGFDCDTDLDNERGSRESFSDRFKRYIRRILPTRRSSRGYRHEHHHRADDHDHEHEHEEADVDDDDHDHHRHRQDDIEQMVDEDDDEMLDESPDSSRGRKTRRRSRSSGSSRAGSRRGSHAGRPSSVSSGSMPFNYHAIRSRNRRSR